MSISDLDIIKLILGSVIPILIYKKRTRSEVILKLKSPFILDLFIALNKIHIKVFRFSSVISFQSEEEKEKEFFDGFDDLNREIQDQLARAKLYLHRSTNKLIDEYLDTIYRLIHSRRLHVHMLQNRAAYSNEDLKKEYDRWSKEFPNKLEVLYEKIVPTLKVELNGYWDKLCLDQELLVFNLR